MTITVEAKIEKLAAVERKMPRLGNVSKLSWNLLKHLVFLLFRFGTKLRFGLQKLQKKKERRCMSAVIAQRSSHNKDWVATHLRCIVASLRPTLGKRSVENNVNSKDKFVALRRKFTLP